MSFFSHLLAEFHLERGGSSSLLILPGLLRSDWGGLSVSSPSGEREDACGLRRWCKFPALEFYSASFLHWISSLSYPYLTTLFIFNSIVSWSPKLSPLRIPWIHWGWTPADDRGWDGWMASPTWWTWVWVNSRSWWWTGRPGMLRFMGLQSWERLSDWSDRFWSER